ncbi:MAG: hypothetical protein AAFR21_07575 [Pseudomonadota bacterium]
MDTLTDGAGIASGQCEASSDGQHEPRLTRNEVLVLDALKSASRPKKAYDLLDELHDNGIRAPMTIYRALEGLSAKGFAQKVVSQNAFVCVDKDDKSDVKAVITCSQCGEIRLVAVPEAKIKALLGNAKMEISGLVIEAKGECPSGTGCRG